MILIIMGINKRISNTRMINWYRFLLLRISLSVCNIGMVLSNGSEFNQEVISRVTERIADFMHIPVETTRRLSEFRDKGGFPHDLHAPDRDFVTKMLSIQTAAEVYYGLEDGTYLFYTDTWYLAIYREPGQDGYNARDVPSNMRKHFISCIDNENGTPKNCIMDVATQYVKCHNDCRLVKCPDVDSQKDCSRIQDDNDRMECKSKIKWCKNYTIEEVREDQAGDFGYIPVTKLCLDKESKPSQTTGEVLIGNAFERHSDSCTYDDMTSEIKVNRTLVGSYAYCGGNGNVCNDTFTGGFYSGQYDPRYRAWYIQAKEEQRALWTEPYPFHQENNMGLTYASPIYSTDSTGKQIFKGVLAVDYDLKHIIELLVTEYEGTDRLVLIVEDAAPNYVIAASTGSSSVSKVLESNNDEPCPNENATCTVVRIPITKFQKKLKDVTLQRAFLEHLKLGFPLDTVVTLKASDEIGASAYISKGGLYYQENASHLKWRIFVVTPMIRSTVDASLPGDTSFVITCVLASVGFLGCASMLWVFYAKRTERAMIYADWRFTCAFLFGCTVMNLSNFTLLGDNSDGLCMLRMWSFNLLFVLALSPLFVKVWRMYQLHKASVGFRRVNVDHQRAILYTLPIVCCEIVILLLFSLVDPPQQVEELGAGIGYQFQEIRCEQNSHAFFMTQLVFDGFLVLIGCALAYKTRDLDPRFGEAKQLGFCMYNIAFTGIMIVTITELLDMDQESKVIIQAVGVAWGTILSCFSFVLPRLFEVARNSKQDENRYSLLQSPSGRYQILVPGATNKLGGFGDGSSNMFRMRDASGKMKTPRSESIEITFDEEPQRTRSSDYCDPSNGVASILQTEQWEHRLPILEVSRENTSRKSDLILSEHSQTENGFPLTADKNIVSTCGMLLTTPSDRTELGMSEVVDQTDVKSGKDHSISIVAQERAPELPNKHHRIIKTYE